MEIIINAVLVKDLYNIEIFPIKLTKKNYKLVRKTLELHFKRLNNICKNLKSKGLIKSIFVPKNKNMKEELEKLRKARKEIKKSINKIKELYYMKYLKKD